MEKSWLEKIPSDVQVDILKRLPFNSLLRLMSTCKSIYAFVTSPTLMLATSVSETGYHIYSYPSSNGEQLFSAYLDNGKVHRFVKNFDSISIDFNYFLLGSIYGLVCFAKTFGCDDSDIILWNPYLGISRKLPIPAAAYEKSCGLGFGFDHHSVDHTVVRIRIIPNYNTCVWADVYAIREKEWKKVMGSISRPASSIMGDGVFVNDSLHWILKFTGEYYDEYSILTYNVAKNVFSEMEIDDVIGHRDMVLTKLTINGSEKLVLYRGDAYYEFSIWVMQEYNVADSWREIYIYKKKPEDVSIKVLHTLKNGDIVISNSINRLLSCSINGNKRTRIKIINKIVGPQLDYVGPLMGSLVFIDEQSGGFLCGKRIAIEGNEDEELKKKKTKTNGSRLSEDQIQENVNLLHERVFSLLMI